MPIERTSAAELPASGSLSTARFHWLLLGKTGQRSAEPSGWPEASWPAASTAAARAPAAPSAAMRLLDMRGRVASSRTPTKVSAKSTQIGFAVHHWGYPRGQMDLDSDGLVLRVTRGGSLVMQTENARRMMRRFQRG